MSSLVPLLVLASLGLIIGAIVDVARKPPGVLSPRAKAGWIAGLVLEASSLASSVWLWRPSIWLPSGLG